MTKTIQGTVHGKTIRLCDDPGLADGAEVEVILRPKTTPAWGEGVQRSAGAWAGVPGIDEVIDQIEGLRKDARFRGESA